MHRKKTTVPSPVDSERPNTIGLRGPDLAALLDELESSDPAAPQQRHFVRWPFRCTSLRLRITHPGGNASVVRVACRNFSRGGMSVLHNSYIHGGSRCTIYLPHPVAGETAVEGWIVRCCHRSRMVHEVGIAFLQPVDIHAFAMPVDDDHFSMECVDPDSLLGTVLHIDDCESSARIFRHHIRHTRLTVASLDDLHRTSVNPDIIMLGHPLHSSRLLGAAAAARRRHPGAALIVLTFERRGAARRSLKALKPDAVLARPVEQALLLRALGEFLIVRTGRDQQQRRQTPARPHDLAQLMGHCAQRLTVLLAREDVGGCRALCVQLAEAATGYGLYGIARLAAQAAAEIVRTTTLQHSQQTIRALIDACRNVKTGRAA